MDRENTLYPLTNPQKRIWYIEKIYPGTSVNNIGGTIRAKGRLNLNELEKAIYSFIETNEGVRIRLKEIDGEAVQYVAEADRSRIEFVDFINSDNPEEAYEDWALKKAKTPFDINDSPLYYFAVFRINDNDNGYFVNLHHLVCDGWSIKLMTEQICQTYTTIMKGETTAIDNKPSYLQYVFSESQYLKSERFSKSREFWLDKFSELPDGIENAKIDNQEGNRKTFYFSENDSKQIGEYVKKNSISLNTLFTTATLIYMSIVEQREDITIGIPVVNRSGAAEKKMIGMFTSTLPLRIKLDSEEVSGLIRSVSSEMKKCLFHQKYPYNLLVQDLQLKKKGYDNLFDICVNYYNTQLGTYLEHFPVENTEFYNGRQIYKMQIIIKEWYGEDRLSLDFDYRVQDYSEEYIEDLFQYLGNIIRQIISYTELKIKNINILTDQQVKWQVHDYNQTEANYPKDMSIYQLFDEQVQKTPHETAVEYKESSLTYIELKRKADCFASYLRTYGVGKDEIVGLYSTHSIATVVGILGILKAGGAFMPIDPAFPAERIRYMLEECKVSIVVANCDLDRDIGFGGEVIQLENSIIYSSAIPQIEYTNSPSDLAYVIYTSGSTGKPKGVLVEQQNLVNYIQWARKVYIKKQVEVFPLYSPLTFDLTITSVFLPLVSGGKIIIYRGEDSDEYVLYRIFKENFATIVKLTPSHLSLIKDMDLRASSIKGLIVGGEDLKVSLSKAVYESFGGDVAIYNEYGPTETVVGCMIHKYDADKDTGTSVPIGMPIDNTQVYVLDKYMRFLSPASIGELYISGDGVTRGYVGKLDLTAEKFIPNPFIRGKKMYKTGDMVKFNHNGVLEYMGRADRQVKIRGHRIELGEIEDCLLNCVSVENSVVTVRQNSHGDKYLCAYLVKNIKDGIEDIKNTLSKFLPSYAIPEIWVELDSIPLTPSGKVNYNLLPEPKIAKNRGFCGKRNEMERILLETVTELIGIDGIGVNDDFYHLGGDSIKAIQLSSKLLNKGYRIKVNQIMSHPVFSEMALCIKSSDFIQQKEQEACCGSIRASPITAWFFEQNFQSPGDFNQSILLKIKSGFEKSQMDQIFQKLIEQHDALRINYDPKTRELFYNNKHLDNAFDTVFLDLSDIGEKEQDEVIRYVCSGMRPKFCIDRDILIRACMFNLGEREGRLFITAHHLVVDGVSWRILAEDIATMMEQVYCGRHISLPQKTCSYQQWCEKIGEIVRNKSLENEKNYWRSILRDSFLNVGYTLKSSIKDSRTVSAHLSQEETAKLLYKANQAFYTTANELMIIALVVTLVKYTGNSEAVLELENHGRYDKLTGQDLSRTVGWFTSMFPACFRTNGTNNLDVLIKLIKEQLRGIPNYGVAFGIFRYLEKDLKDTSEGKRIRFNFLGDMDGIGDGVYVKDGVQMFWAYSAPNNHMTCLMDINAAVIEKRLTVYVTCGRDGVYENKCEEFLHLFIMSIKNVVDFCCSREANQFTPSDFEMVNLSQEEINILFK